MFSLLYGKCPPVPLNVILYRVISGERLAKPAVVSLCCGVARRVIDEFGLGVAESQARRLAEAVVSRLGRGISGEFVVIIFGIRRKLEPDKPGLFEGYWLYIEHKVTQYPP